jgi:hypothetical protein
MFIKYEKCDNTCEHENGATWKSKLLNQKVFRTLYIIDRALKPITPPSHGSKFHTKQPFLSHMEKEESRGMKALKAEAEDNIQTELSHNYLNCC